MSPRYTTLLDIVRVLGLDIMLVPRSLVPVVQSLIRDVNASGEQEERPLYADHDDEELV